MTMSRSPDAAASNVSPKYSRKYVIVHPKRPARARKTALFFSCFILLIVPWKENHHLSCCFCCCGGGVESFYFAAASQQHQSLSATTAIAAATTALTSNTPAVNPCTQQQKQQQQQISSSVWLKRLVPVVSSTWKNLHSSSRNINISSSSSFEKEASSLSSSSTLLAHRKFCNSHEHYPKKTDASPPLSSPSSLPFSPPVAATKLRSRSSKFSLSSLWTAFVVVCRQHSAQIKRISWTGLQLGVAFWLLQSLWNALNEAVDEIILAETGSGGGGSDANGDYGMSPFEPRRTTTTEAHDAPYLSPMAIDTLVRPPPPPPSPDSEDKKKRRRTVAERMAAATDATALDLAKRLVASGLPWTDDDNAGNNGSSSRHDLWQRHQHGNQHKLPSVESILRSLTRTEGQVLASTLWAPAAADDDDDNGDNRQKDLWSDIGGLAHVKESLTDLLLVMNQQQLQHSPSSSSISYRSLLQQPPGVLLYGPPGCGKTLLAKAFATSANARILIVTPSTLLRKYVGDSNLRLRALFSAARKLAPSIIFVDELDGLFRERSSEEHSVNRDLKTEFIQLWDGIVSSSTPSSSRKNKVLVIGATNRPFDVDSAFLRRMPRSYYVGLPNRDERFIILHHFLKNVPLDPGNFDFAQIAQLTEGYSPSDLKEVLQMAAILGPLKDYRIKQKQQQAAAAICEVLDEPRVVLPPPTMRPLTTQDVLNVRVAPTPMSPKYKAALIQFGQRAGHFNFSPQQQLLLFSQPSSPPPLPSLTSNIFDLGTIVYGNGRTFQLDNEQHNYHHNNNYYNDCPNQSNNMDRGSYNDDERNYSDDDDEDGGDDDVGYFEDEDSELSTNDDDEDGSL